MNQMSVYRIICYVVSWCFRFGVLLFFAFAFCVLFAFESFKMAKHNHQIRVPHAQIIKYMYVNCVSSERMNVFF